MSKSIRIIDKSQKIKWFRRSGSLDIDCLIAGRRELKQYQFLLYMVFLVFAGNCHADTSLDATLRQMDEQRRQYELEVQRGQIQSLRNEADIARMRAESDQVQAQINAYEAEKKAQQVAAEQEETAKILAQKSEQAASALQDEITRASVRTRN